MGWPLKRVRIAKVRLWTKAWLERLGLTEWRVAVRWATRRDIEAGLIAEDEDGSVTWQVENHVAEILLSYRLIKDPEVALHTIVHECLHLRNESHLDKPRRYDSHYEHGLNEIAAALIAASKTIGRPDLNG
jgi:hypothetical protein